MSLKDIFTAEEVAKYLRIHPYTVRRLARAGKLPGFLMSTGLMEQSEHKSLCELTPLLYSGVMSFMERGDISPCAN